MRRHIIPVLMMMVVSMTAQAQKTNDHNFEVAKHLDIFNHVYKNLELLLDTMESVNVLDVPIKAEPKRSVSLKGI